MNHQLSQLLLRHTDNPILSATNWPYRVNSVFNPGATLLADGTTLLLCRVEDRRGISHLCAARSANGIDNWVIDPQPTLVPDAEAHPSELWGIEDPRVTYIPELKQYAVVYTAYSPAGPGVALALTQDFSHFDRYGLIMQPEDKDACLLPRRINGHWALIHRPVSATAAHMWISYSDDLRNWGSHTLMMEARLGAWWDSTKIGLSPPPIETSEGWLAIYHGVKLNAAGALYRLGLALFDLEAPERCIKRSSEWFFCPETSYERRGDVDNVVFPCGYTLAPDGDTLRVYYGAADTSIAMATGSVKSMLEWLHQQD
ncbi:MAG TPA: hypothetical protein VGJ22_14215 [Anaerolineales bacterium]